MINKESLEMWYQQQADGTLKCMLCAHGCRLADDQKGICGVRMRRGDKIESLVYGRLIAANIDPIEKKPLYHLMPGSLSYSIATHGCNFRCLHCQNSSISQVSKEQDVEHSGRYCTPDEVVTAAVRSGCQSISYTYVEPTVFFEFALDCCRIAVDQGLKNIFVSNGYMTKEVLAALTPVLAAINIDLKSFSDAFYKKVCGARLQPVLDNIKRCHDAGIWVEVTTLIIPGLNDGDEELKEIAEFLVGVAPSIPWHVSGYHPAYRMSSPSPTPASTLARAREIGLAGGLRYVYTGNRPGLGGEDTLCHSCGTLLLARRGFRVTANRLQHGCCPACGSAAAGLW